MNEHGYALDYQDCVFFRGSECLRVTGGDAAIADIMACSPSKVREWLESDHVSRGLER